MRKQIITFLVVSAVTVMAAFISQPVTAKTYTVLVQNFSFSPSTLNVFIGDTVHFQWVEGMHTTTCDATSLPGTSSPSSPTFYYNGWNAMIDETNTDYYVPIINPGTYTYGCIPHWPSMQGTINATIGYKYWAGAMTGGDGSSWNDPLNWLDGTTPATTDSVMFDNSFATTTYLVTLPGGAVNTTVAKIVIKPTIPNVIYLTLPTSNTGNPGMTLGNSNSTYDFVIYKNGVFRNQSGASAGTGVAFALANDSIQILDSGLWIHNCTRGTSGVVQRLSKLSNTKYGIWRYDVPTLSSFSITASGISYPTLEFSGVAGGGSYMSKKYIMAGGTALTVRGNFYIDEYCYDSSAMTNNLNIGGDFTMYGKFVWATPASPQIINFNGTTVQNISCGGLFAENYQLSGRVQFNNFAGFNIKTPFYVDSVYMMNGNISSLNGAWLGVGYDATNKGFLSRTGGIVTGQIERWYLAGVVSDSLYYPVGTSTTLKPAYVKFSTAPTTAGRIGLKFIDNGTDGTDLTTPLNDGGYIINRRSNSYWQMTGTWLTSGLIDVSLNASGQEGISNPANLRVIWSNDGGASFSLQGSHLSGFTTTARRTDIPYYFSDFYIGAGNADNTLPVELASFTSSVSGRNAVLSWITSSEQNNSHFEIERKNGIDDKWSYAGRINGAGNSNTFKNYTFTDKGLNTGKYNYRLKQVDFNGNTNYHNLSNIVIVGIPGKYEISQNYPNPFNPKTKINYDLPVDSKVSIKIYDISGREVKQLVNTAQTAGYYTVNFNASSLSSGVYFYSINAQSGNGNFMKTMKMLLIK